MQKEMIKTQTLIQFSFLNELFRISLNICSEYVELISRYSFLFENHSNSCTVEQSQIYIIYKDRDVGARYLDPKYSLWKSADPALAEYIPIASTNDEWSKKNSNLPGMGGLFNHTNFHLYHYAGNNPIRYTDPNGRYTFDAQATVIVHPSEITDWGNRKTIRNIKEITSSFTDDTAYQKLVDLIMDVGEAWADDDNSLRDSLEKSLTYVEDGITVGEIMASLCGTTLLPPPLNVIVPSTLLLCDFLLSITNDNQLEKNLKRLFQFSKEYRSYKKEDGCKLVDFTITETFIETEDYGGINGNHPWEIKKKERYLELTASFYNPKYDLDGYEDKSDYKTVYKLLGY
ncbi:MAG: hypothetical protein K6E97_12215 [Treponema sp.]|nr:hypothetical protein [Treponema sp.]